MWFKAYSWVKLYWALWEQPPPRNDSAVSSCLTLALQACREYLLLWGLQYVNRTYFGLFGATGLPACIFSKSSMSFLWRSPEWAAVSASGTSQPKELTWLKHGSFYEIGGRFSGVLIRALFLRPCKGAWFWGSISILGRLVFGSSHMTTSGDCASLGNPQANTALPWLRDPIPLKSVSQFMGSPTTPLYTTPPPRFPYN